MTGIRNTIATLAWFPATLAAHPNHDSVLYALAIGACAMLFKRRK